MGFKRIISLRAVGGRAVALLLAAVMLCACEDGIFTDQSDCPRGLGLRFVYDYNMEYADAFSSQVDCITLFVFDDEGRYITTIANSGEQLAEEDYSIQLDLDPGRYTLVAYGGLGCPMSSFAVEPVEAARARSATLSALKTAPQILLQMPSSSNPTSDIEKLRVRLIDDVSYAERPLHDLYFGRLEVELHDEEYKEEVISMMKNTNSIRVVLQQVAGQSLDDEQFTFSITDANTIYDSHNRICSPTEVRYSPWATGDGVVGSWDDSYTPVSVAYAEFSCARLHTDNEPRLEVRRSSDEGMVLSIPLNKYLLLLRGQLYAQMPEQEYLDRESRWSLIFFLDEDNRWVSTRVVINDWVVRINDAEL